MEKTNNCQASLFFLNFFLWFKKKNPKKWSWVKKKDLDESIVFDFFLSGRRID